MNLEGGKNLPSSNEYLIFAHLHALRLSWKFRIIWKPWDESKGFLLIFFPLFFMFLFSRVAVFSFFFSQINKETDFCFVTK